MSPTIVLDPSHEPFLVLGAAGGPTIITAVAQVILNVVDQHMSLADAMYAPRVHDQAWPDSLEFERGGLTTSAEDSLRQMGHHLDPVGSLTNVNALMRDGRGGWVGVFEPRATGEAAGY